MVIFSFFCIPFNTMIFHGLGGESPSWVEITVHAITPHTIRTYAVPETETTASLKQTRCFRVFKHASHGTGQGLRTRHVKSCCGWLLMAPPVPDHQKMPIKVMQCSWTSHVSEFHDFWILLMGRLMEYDDVDNCEEEKGGEEEEE